MFVANEKDRGLPSGARNDDNPSKSPTGGALAQSMKKFAFFVCHHKPGPLFKDEIFIPIHVGAANSNQVLPDCIRDDVGENISRKNASYCELTAIYWAWKNVEADYYGFFHYRRLMNFKSEKKPVSLSTICRRERFERLAGIAKPSRRPAHDLT